MSLNVFKESNEAIEALAKVFVEKAKTAIAQNNKFSVALSGGSSPKKLYDVLANNYAEAIDWTKVYFFFGDERYVAHDHADSNYLLAKNGLFDALPINENQIFKVDTSLDPASAALEYQRSICAFFDNKTSFDLIILGLGDDAHTASIFPNTALIWIDEELVKEVYLEDKKVYRISFTAPLINQAKEIAFLTFGANKADAIKAVLEGEKDVEQYPAQLIKPVNGNLSWFVDEAAVSKLEKK
ncbi:6-phosphogluconolactonase [Pedobacter alpinus]|uniref:6-phosphogluconolactonase n=1 Tax=Pedobacter alpinus TaxID=1590643 RepID=A0ABW5TP48_9SPHI